MVVSLVNVSLVSVVDVDVDVVVLFKVKDKEVTFNVTCAYIGKCFPASVLELKVMGVRESVANRRVIGIFFLGDSSCCHSVTTRIRAASMM